MSTQRAVPEGRHQPYRFDQEIQQRVRALGRELRTFLARDRVRAARGAAAARVDALVEKSTGGTVACVC